MLLLFLPANTTDSLQPLDLSINEVPKDLRNKFRHWYPNEVSRSLQNEPENEVVPVNMQAGVMKELRAMWLVAFYDHVCSHPDLVVIGFKEAGIVDALENGVVPYLNMMKHYQMKMKQKIPSWTYFLILINLTH